MESNHYNKSKQGIKNIEKYMKNGIICGSKTESPGSNYLDFIFALAIKS